jgi:hypothetical protein
MKFQIDTNLKTIKLEEKALLKDVLDIMKAMFPDDWKEYSIETNCIISWNSPTYVFPKRTIWDLQPYWYNTIGGYNTNYNQYLDLNNQYTTSCNSDMSNIINVETNN